MMNRRWAPLRGDSELAEEYVLTQCSSAFAGGDGFGFGLINAEKAENSAHLEGLGDEIGGLDELCASPQFRGQAQRVDDGANARRIHEGRPLEIDNEKNMPAGQRRLERALKLIHRLSADETPLQFEGADTAAFPDVQVH